MDTSLSLLILWLQLDCELEGFGNRQRMGNSWIFLSREDRSQGAVPAWFLGVPVESEKVNLKLVSKE